ncbi:wd repeat [Anaeramoeba flamelloides]|uniref:Wd repeat n=1 Tax=Anaeramoeba flamelloides TaxID=1746091 RepID=A0ABQ8Y614_9EUKA|nr:wd repeat [Anaeramoeba flamelloides]
MGNKETKSIRKQIRFSKRTNSLNLNNKLVFLSKKQKRQVLMRVGKLKRLRSINLANNNLDSVPYCLQKLYHLQIVDLHNNQIERIPNFLYQMINLKQLNLGDNSLQTISPKIVRLINLEQLKLEGNKFKNGKGIDLDNKEEIFEFIIRKQNNRRRNKKSRSRARIKNKSPSKDKSCYPSKIDNQQLLVTRPKNVLAKKKDFNPLRNRSEWNQNSKHRHTPQLKYKKKPKDINQDILEYQKKKIRKLKQMLKQERMKKKHQYTQQQLGQIGKMEFIGLGLSGDESELNFTYQGNKIPKTEWRKICLRVIDLLDEPNIRSDFIGPISLEIMIDPVICSDGLTYEREEIEWWLEKNKTSPKTRQVINDKTLVDNLKLREEINQFINSLPMLGFNLDY